MDAEAYREYLQSSAWAKLRRQVLMRAAFICEGCGAKPAVEVHHKTYEHVGDEFLFELTALCKECHGRLHGRGLCQDFGGEQGG